ncbi:MAG: BON domain-containing protein, partial [Acidobacteriota bacterium]|nr:BON domain-containing protein [Acidobacteriota bacterium]
MKTNQPLLLRAFPRVLAWALAISLCGAMAPAQDTTAAPAQENPPAAANGQRTDAQIEMDVVHALDASQTLKNDLITAATIQSEVTLSGTVASESNKELAASIAAQVPGVTKVHDNLKVGNPQDAQNPQDTQSPMAADEGAPQTADNQPSTMPAPAPSQGPYDQGPTAQGPYNRAPYNPGPPAQGPYNQGPSAQGPYNQGPYNQGPSTQGPYNQGPYDQGPSAQGPYNRGPYNQGPYAQQGQPQYAPAQRSAPAYRTATGPVTVPQGTLLQLRTSEPVDSKRAVDGTPVQFTLIRDVTLGDVLAIPRGATVHGVVTEVKQASPIKGSPELALTVTALDLGGRTYPLYTDQFKVKGPSKT